MTTVKITPLNVGSLLFNLGAIYRLPEDHPENGRSVQVPITGYHIALPGRSILVDAPAYTPEHMGCMLIPDFIPPLSLVEQLNAKGIAPESISDVIITHLHFDHFSGLTSHVDGRYVPNFPNARHYLSAGDWDPDDFDDLEEQTVVVINDAGLLDLVTESTSLGDGLTILPMPGETPGHQIISLEHDTQRAFFTGDLFHHEIEFTYPGINVFWSDQEIMPISKGKFLMEAVGRDHQVYFAHIPGPYSVSAQGDGFDWRPLSQ